MSKKNESIVNIALSYWLDGASLDKALADAQAKYKKENATSYRNSEKASKAQANMLLALTKSTNNKIKRANKQSVKTQIKEEEALLRKKNAKRIAEEKKTNNKIAADRKKSFSGGFDNFGGKIGTISSYGAAIAIINGVKQAFTYAIEKAIEFEVAFTDLAVKAGYSNEEMVKVTGTIRDVASSTHFSTVEITSAATALGKLGFEAEEVVEVLPSLGSVAAATGESLQATAEILGKVINAYGYSADQSGIIADRMVDIFNNSALSLEKFNTAFSYVGSAAASTGTSFDELTAAMAVLADRGVTASKIGTGLRNVFTKLGNEGDSLRDILQRISEEHLSFYEVAEVVGRRAANQLFIMADSLDEFDATVARSSADFGAALEASSKQMDTFKSKWDIFLNSITNYVMPEFDPDDTWKDSISQSIDLMDVWNSFWNEENSFASMRRLINIYPEFREEFRKTREEMAEGTLDDDILDEMADRAIASADAYERGSKEWYRVINYAKALRRANLTMTDESQAVTTGLANYDEEKLKNEAKKLVLSWENALKGTVTAIGATYGSDAKDSFIQQYFSANPNDVESLRKTLNELKADGKTTNEEINKLFDGFKYRTEEFEKNFRISNSGTYISALEKKFRDAQEAIKKLNADSLKFDENTLEEDAGLVQEAIDKEKKIAKEICDKYPRLATKLGIVCSKASKSSKRGEIGEFELNQEKKSAYEVQKDRLTKEYNLLDGDDEIIERSKKNDELIKLEFEYREGLNAEYERYLDKQDKLRAAFVKKYPDQASEFDENIRRTQDASTKNTETGNKNINTYELRNLSATKEAYKQAFNDRQAYLAKVAELDKKYRDPENDTPRKRAEILKQRNEVTVAYYNKAEKDLKTYYEKLNKLKKDLDARNVEIINSDGTPIDIKEIEELLNMEAGHISKLRAERDKAIKSEGADDGFKDFDYFGSVMEAYDSVTSLVNQIGDAKLEILKQQVERELEVISDRYDRENELVNSALEAGIISQEQATEAEERLRKKKIDAENKANKKLFEAQKKRDTQEAIFTGLSSTAQAIAGAFAKNLPPVAVVMASISAAAIAASTAMNLKAINQRKFVPQKYAEGGLVYGKSHAQGGIPFTVRGRGGYEMEGGEFIVNKEATRNNLAELERINGKTKRNQKTFATGGQISVETTEELFNEQILEALSKPVRAYVTNQDLEESESERRALTNKTSY